MYPPGPATLHRWNVIGLLRKLNAMRLDMLGFVGGRFEAHGDLYHIAEQPSGHLYVTRHPDHMHEVLVDKASHYVKTGGAMDALIPFVGQGLLTSDGELWRRQRRWMQPGFHRKAIGGYAATMTALAERLDWSDGDRIDMGEQMRQLTLRIAAKTLFDHDVDADSDTIASVMAAFHEGTENNLLPSWLPTPGRRRGRAAIAQMDALIERITRERRATGLRDDLLSMLLGIEGISDRQLRDELVTLFIAGHDTTSHAMTWTAMLLAQHPQVRAQLEAEVDALDGAPTVDDLPRLGFTKAVLQEAMRLYPPAYAVARVAAEPTELAGYPLETGAQVVMWIWHAHHDPRWFPEPHRFRPQRFIEPTHPRHAYLPFGAGSRMCIGSGFAMMEMQLVLASLTRRYRLDLEGQPPGVKPRVTLGPDGPMPMRVALR